MGGYVEDSRSARTNCYGYITSVMDILHLLCYGLIILVLISILILSPGDPSCMVVSLLLLCWPFCVYVSTVSLARCGGPAWLTLAYMRDVSKREEKEGFNNYFHIDGLQ